ncbi:calcium/sodium antiporter, partial [Nanoarchaeota archaeon]
MIDLITMPLFVIIIIFLAALFVLIKSADFFTDAAEDIGLALGIPQFIVGVTIVSVGTSLPELASSLISVTRGASEFVVGNVVGSNIANILLVLGIAAIVAKKMKMDFDLVKVDLPLLLGSSFLLGALIYFAPFSGQVKMFTLFSGILCIVGYVIYVMYAVSHHEKEKKKKHPFKWKSVGILLIGAVFIYLGAEFVIDSVIAGGTQLGVSTSVIALSAVALGTSLPELTVSIQAVRKKKYEVAVGNALGSNIFNTFIVMGIPAMFGSLVIPMSIITFALPFMIGATLLFIISIMDKEISRYEGLMFVLFYIVFIWKLFTFLQMQQKILV